MTESTPPEGQQPLTVRQMQQLHSSLTEKVLDKAASDPEWRQLLLDDPEAAMQAANFPEAQQLEQQGPQRAPQQGEVVGQQESGSFSGLGTYGYVSPYGRRCRAGEWWTSGRC